MVERDVLICRTTTTFHTIIHQLIHPSDPDFVFFSFDFIGAQETKAKLKTRLRIPESNPFPPLFCHWTVSEGCQNETVKRIDDEKDANNVHDVILQMRGILLVGCS